MSTIFEKKTFGQTVEKKKNCEAGDFERDI